MVLYQGTRVLGQSTIAPRLPLDREDIQETCLLAPPPAPTSRAGIAAYPLFAAVAATACSERNAQKTTTD